MHNFNVMEIQKNIVLTGSNNRQFATDIFYLADDQPKPVIIYTHGFNGFKDWANFDLIAKQFATAGFVFIKFNTSHNGTTPEHPEDFVDLEAYGQNNYTKELYDLQVVIDWSLSNENPHSKYINEHKLYLIGHSRGGGVVIIKAAEDARVKAITTWASVSEAKTPWGSWSDNKMKEWKATGVQYYLNGRTNQQMPIYYQLYEDHCNNAERLNIIKAISSLRIPVLICHGTKDEAVPVEKAGELQQAQPSAALFLVSSDHVFGRKHPWTEENLPTAMQEVVDRTISFFQQQSLA
jgi:uncharacterized protein